MILLYQYLTLNSDHIPFSKFRLSLKQKSWTTSRNTSTLFASLDISENKAKSLRTLELKNSSLPEENVNIKPVHNMALSLIIILTIRPFNHMFSIF